jgi:hypothetical protein
VLGVAAFWDNPKWFRAVVMQEVEESCVLTPTESLLLAFKKGKSLEAMRLHRWRFGFLDAARIYRYRLDRYRTLTVSTNLPLSLRPLARSY